jgi:preprotein translocase subunit YajC
VLEGPAPFPAAKEEICPVFALLAQAADQQQSPFGAFGLLVPAALFFVIFYFIVMRPQARQQNAHKDFLAKLGKGDEVITSGGVVGKVDRVAGDLVFVEVANNVKLRVLKQQIQGPYKTVEEKPAEEAAKKG